MLLADNLPIFGSIPCRSISDGKKIRVKFRNASDYCLWNVKSYVDKGLCHFHVYEKQAIDEMINSESLTASSNIPLLSTIQLNLKVLHLKVNSITVHG